MAAAAELQQTTSTSNSSSMVRTCIFFLACLLHTDSSLTSASIQSIMEIIAPFKAFYTSMQKMKDNDKQCPHILSRFEALNHVTSQIKQEDSKGMSEDLRAGVDKLNAILESTGKFVQQFNNANPVIQMVKANTYKAEFEELNKSLTDAFVTFSAALHIHQEKKLDDQHSTMEQQQEALKELLKETTRQEHEADLQKEKQVEQEKKLQEQETRLARQERRLEEQQEKLAEQEEALERLEAKAVLSSTAFYCTLL